MSSAAVAPVTSGGVPGAARPPRRVWVEQVMGMPVSIHVRGDEAFDELLDVWRAEGRGEIEGVLHCYTGTLEFARRAIAAGSALPAGSESAFCSTTMLISGPCT